MAMPCWWYDELFCTILVKQEVPAAGWQSSEKPSSFYCWTANRWSCIRSRLSTVADWTPKILVVLNKHQHFYWAELCNIHHFKIKHTVVEGGEQRFHSVKKWIGCHYRSRDCGHTWCGKAIGFTRTHQQILPWGGKKGELCSSGKTGRLDQKINGWPGECCIKTGMTLPWYKHHKHLMSGHSKNVMKCHIPVNSLMMRP